MLLGGGHVMAAWHNVIVVKIEIETKEGAVQDPRTPANSHCLLAHFLGPSVSSAAPRIASLRLSSD